MSGTGSAIVDHAVSDAGGQAADQFGKEQANALLCRLAGA